MIKIFLTITFFFSSFLSAAELRVLTEDKPALNYLKEGQLVGQSIDVVREIMKRLKLTTKIEVLPWARAYDLLQREPNIALFSTSRIEPRENLFKWIGPIARKDWVFIVKKKSPLKIQSIEDAKKVALIGTYQDDSKEQYLKSIGFKNLETVIDDSLNPKKLLAGRIDMWISALIDYKITIEAEKLNVDDFQVGYTVKKQELYIAVSKQTDDALVKKWQTAFEGMVQDGTLAKIHAKYTTKN